MDPGTQDAHNMMNDAEPSSQVNAEDTNFEEVSPSSVPLTAGWTQTSTTSPDSRLSFPIQDDNMPSDLPMKQAEAFRESFRNTGSSWFNKSRKVKITFIWIPLSELSRSHPQVHRRVCESEEDVQDCLARLDVDHNTVLVLVHNAHKENSLRFARDGIKCDKRPCMTRAILVMLAKAFKITPSIITQIWRCGPALTEHVIRSNKKESNESVGEFTWHFSYAIPVVWSAINSKNATTLPELFSVAAYSIIDQKSVPRLSLLSNLPDDWATSIEEAWQSSLYFSTNEGSCALCEHFVLMRLSLEQLRHDLILLEVVQYTRLDVRFEMHLASGRTNQEETICLFRQSENAMRVIQTAVNNVQKLATSLDTTSMHKFLEKYNRVGRGQTSIIERKVALQNVQHVAQTIQDHFDHNAHKVRSDIALVLDMLALDNSKLLAHNTARIANMAKATEQSGAEVQTMTKRMEEDARLVKFLAEVTAVFLPITAMATVFSMDFFNISDTSTGMIPTLRNLKYFWLYFCVAGTASLGVFGWWIFKHYQLKSTAKKSDAADPANRPNNRLEAIENLVEQADPLGTQPPIIPQEELLRELQDARREFHEILARPFDRDDDEARERRDGEIAKAAMRIWGAEFALGIGL